MPTLHEIGRGRIWAGIPSTTQLLNPTRIEYLKIKKDYAIDPFDMAFALLGTRHHQRLDAVAKKIDGLISEKPLKGEITGILDLLEPDMEPDTWRLIDYKTWGAYALAKILGLTQNGERDKKIVELQLNHYRIKVAELGFKVTHMFVQCTVRDGGTFIAKKAGIEVKLKLVPIEFLPDDKVLFYFNAQRENLLNAIESNTLPPMCGYEDRWGGKRCKSFCSVAEFCPEGAMVNRIALRE